MKFLFVANFLNDENSGAAGNIMQLCRALDERGSSTRHIFRDSFYHNVKRNIFMNALLFLSFPVIITPVIFYLDLINRYDYVVISSGDGFLYALFSKAFLRRRRPILIKRSHGYEFLFKREFDIEKRLDRNSHWRIREKAFLFGFRLMQVRIFSYLCDSIFTLNDKEKVYLEGIYPKKRIFATPIGIDHIFISQRELERNKDVLFVGTWCRMKGRVYLTRIISKMAEDISGLTVSIIGTGISEKDVLFDFPEHTRGRIRVVRSLSKSMLKEEYGTHKVFLFPSLFEGYGNVILEAMASGMVVIVSKDLGAAEIIRDGYNGFLVEKRDVDGFARTAERVLKDETLMRDIGSNARETVSGMTWEKIADMFIKECEEFRVVESATKSEFIY